MCINYEKRVKFESGANNCYSSALLRLMQVNCTYGTFSDSSYFENSECYAIHTFIFKKLALSIFENYLRKITFFMLTKRIKKSFIPVMQK